MPAIVFGDGILGRMVEITISNDPFTVYADHRQIQRKDKNMPRAATTTTASSAKELRRRAKALSVPNWEEMSKEELESAIADQDGESSDDSVEEATPPARTRRTSATKAAAPTKKATTARPKAAAKTTAKPAAAAKKTSKRTASSTPKEGETNPFREGTNLWYITEALMKGGKRSVLVNKLKGKLEYNPRVQDAKDFDVEAETDRRLKVVGYILRNKHGFEYEHEGRGPDAYIKVSPPS